MPYITPQTETIDTDNVFFEDDSSSVRPGLCLTQATVIGPDYGSAVYMLDANYPEIVYRQIFESLANQWKRETLNLSSIDQITLNDAYQRIIGMGSSVLPLILERLQEKDEMWFSALSSIAGEDPVPQNRRGEIEYMRQMWLEWGRRNVPNF